MARKFIVLPAASGGGAASTVTLADAAGDTTTSVVLAGGATGTQALLTDSGLTYNATTDALTATTFVGALTGVASGNVPDIGTPVDNAVVRADGTGGLTLQPSTATISDAGVLNVAAEDAGTNTVLAVAKLTRTTSDTPAAGIGGSLQFEVETASTPNLEIGGEIQCLTTDVGSGTEDFDIVLKTMVAGSTTLVESMKARGAAIMLPQGTAAAPSLRWGTDTNAGFFQPAASVAAFSSASNENFRLGSRITARGDGHEGGFQWTSSSASSGTVDTAIYREAASVIGAAINTTTAGGWFQNSGGSKRLSGNATNATTTMSNLTDLSVTVAAGRKYAFRASIYFAQSTAADGFKFDFEGGSATMTSFRCHGIVHDQAVELLTQSNTAIATDFSLAATGTGDHVLEVSGCFVVNAGGTLIPRFANVAATTGTSTVYLNSFVLYEDVP